MSDIEIHIDKLSPEREVELIAFCLEALHANGIQIAAFNDLASGASIGFCDYEWTAAENGELKCHLKRKEEKA